MLSHKINQVQQKHKSLRKITIFFLFFWLICALATSFSFSQANAAPNMGNIAKRYIGLHEVKHRKKLQNIMGINPRRVPWCGGFVAIVMKRSGKTPPRHYLAAKSYAGWGRRVNERNAKKGDIAVIRNRRGHHVGIVVGKYKNGLILVSGNSSNRVKTGKYSYGSIISVRR